MAQKYGVTKYEVALSVNGKQYSIGYVYPRSRSAMGSLFVRRSRSPKWAEAVNASNMPNEMPWNGKHQRWTNGTSWLGFSGRTEREAEANPLTDLLSLSIS